MPELPDIEGYLQALWPKVVGRVLDRISVVSPFVLRSVDPPLDAAEGCTIRALRRVGKRVVLELAEPVDRDVAGGSGPLFLVIHLMVAGRFQWKAPGEKPPGKITLATFRFASESGSESAGGGGTLVLTEAGTKKRASIFLCRGEAALREHDPGGLELLDEKTTVAQLAAALKQQNRTLKRAMTDPRTLSGIGNAYSDEILLEAGLSPILLTTKLTDAQCEALLETSRAVLSRWSTKLAAEFQNKFPGPGDVTAFRPEFGAHGKFGKPCPNCKTPIQRIVRAENEINYCPRCQTGGKVLADRSLSRLLKDDWPRTVEELEG